MPETEAAQAEVMGAWHAWYGVLGDKVLDPGNPLGPPTAVAGGGASPGSSPDTSGYVIIQADSLDDAVALAQSNPHVKSGGQAHIYEAFNM